jgi:hypothetical protein
MVKSLSPTVNFLDKGSQVYNVKASGAVGNGITDKVVLQSNVNLLGVGYHSYIKQKNGVNVNRFIYGATITNVTIDNLVVDYNHANNTSVGEGMGIGEQSSYVTIQNCLFGAAGNNRSAPRRASWRTWSATPRPT